MTESAFTNARIVLGDEIVDGSIRIVDGTIAAVDAGGSVGEDCEGDYLIPGLIELHTDQLEAHYRPRPGVYWNPLGALMAHDVQIAGSGITTVFDAVRIGSEPEQSEGGMGDHIEVLIEAITAGVADGRLRADHLVHLRCELPTPDVVDDFERFCDLPLVRLASVMDHTPGQRQYQTMGKFVAFYKERMRFSDAEIDAFIAARRERQQRYAAASRAAILKRGLAAGIAFASHDDATPEHVAESVRDGVSIAEFPTTMVAAEQSHAAGLAVLMGAPNVVRGGSHSGNIAATDLAREGCLDVLSSDYVPGALIQAAFMLPQVVEGVGLPRAIGMVTATPARAAHLADRGEIASGKRADLVRVRLHGDMPVIRGVWRQGRRVS
ncbi:MAG: phosphonate metabolism protein PhnM [Devosia sp. 67-54]|uniref:alpha-D-ribose 1-methylphosphonate 5-triphosphate diphosphatase n=1 Tax=unclassified Devosia TaxID=196773 RepID=UPI000964077E|nr:MULTISPECIES: alpha-D-ribose 1-methylphosphonate 5-triphosphate diphosphatase [unclassified Devosia]MBN9304580.1 alpha-D-ribose 1-methylphosphonate 5-triphosphate diphosphatase [Devosia sp.]OJX15428.1 MAG: phosphonate metabolism protein PhnM [Devosia sp. 67-54]